MGPIAHCSQVVSLGVTRVGVAASSSLISPGHDLFNNYINEGYKSESDESYTNGGIRRSLQP
jgi:hypothetical protein